MSLKCRDVSELATGYMERDLPPRTWLAVQWHLMLCSMCRAYLDQLQRTRRLLGGRGLSAETAAAEERALAARPPGAPPA
ncbi:MAG: hypothetical protein KGJ41_14510 [Rhodospirillales bacterium]|nr:hypothetical protein [Rhodospirillales bacterium]MDE2576887.1 hypothetical protein [Rhodospirillales bacterium]